MGRLHCPDDYFLSSLLGFGLLSGVPGACRAAHGDLDGTTPKVAMLHGRVAPTKMAGCGCDRNIRKMQLLFEKCPHSILFYSIFVVRGAKMKFLQMNHDRSLVGCCCRGRCQCFRLWVSCRRAPMQLICARNTRWRTDAASPAARSSRLEVGSAARTVSDSTVVFAARAAARRAP